MGHHPCFVSCRQHSRHKTANENTPGYNSSEYSEVIPELLHIIIVSVDVFVILAELYIYPVVGLLSGIKDGTLSQETYPREGTVEGKRSFYILCISIFEKERKDLY